MALNPVQSLRRAEAQLEKQLGSIQVELDKVRGALKLLAGKSATGKTGRKGRRMSAATRKKMAASAKARWAKVGKKES
jgi:hypothetical protein